jgi:RNA polymerase sigma-70 factor (ECF subfamily)
MPDEHDAHDPEANPGAADRLGYAEAGAADRLGYAEAGAADRLGYAEAGAGRGALLENAVNRGASTASNREARRREAEEDRELIGRAKRGDHSAFRALVERHQRRVFVIAMGLVHDENDARELVQDAFLRVYKGLGAFQGGSSFFTWLYRIVMNLAIDLMRKPGRRDLELQENHVVDEEAEFPLVSRIDGADPLDVIRRREIARRIQEALDELPPYHRGVILMREVEGMSYEEMARAMGVSKGTIMSRLYHARQKLQRALADCYAEERGAGPEDREELA